MHELGRYLQRELDVRGWSVSDLSRRSGISRQTVYNLINDNREHMDQTPQRKTVNGLSEALGIDPVEILIVSAQALGVPVELRPASAGLANVSNEQILMELASRLSRREGSNENQDESQANPPGPRTLRAVGSSREVIAGQKNTPEDPEFLKPLEREQMAAHPNVKLHRDKFDEIYGDAGEENQDTDGE